MKREKKLKNPVASFIMLTNLIFWPLFCLVGLAKMLEFPEWVFQVMLTISAWSSTFAFAVLFKRIYPEQRFAAFVKEKFKHKLKGSVLAMASLIQVSIFLLIMLIVIVNYKPDSIFTISSWGMLIYYFLKNLLSGPLGEEIGWRAFALMELQKRHSPLKASVIIGFWWGLWHLPIWFTTGYTGMELIQYVFFFMVSIISTSILMTACYNLNQNLIVPIIIHQFFNFFIGLINGNLVVLITYNAFFYLAAAILIVMINPKKVMYGKKDTTMVSRYLP
ncbi:CPBP family intramembrane glutamic endopeptidase [Paenibacillus sp. 1001270B_150601_E10]|uniref:CPBP family intramembrane glutamic endopeptidase n=1 Tax=Paenibacillus sp. 1001270B_150601_E10 TaxID=2787079 RepID=UPI00189EC1D2|nr:type II CAAX endopeptidase family protein [Paenibacillus sp. 1001270B_150601_E10]